MQDFSVAYASCAPERPSVKFDLEMELVIPQMGQGYKTPINQKAVVNYGNKYRLSTQLST